MRLPDSAESSGAALPRPGRRARPAQGARSRIASDSGFPRRQRRVTMRVVAGRISSTELVGREEALAALRHALVTRPTDPRSVVLVAGDAGIGKSRLLAAFAESITADPPSDTVPVVLRGGSSELT